MQLIGIGIGIWTDGIGISDITFSIPSLYKLSLISLTTTRVRVRELEVIQINCSFKIISLASVLLLI